MFYYEAVIHYGISGSSCNYTVCEGSFETFEDAVAWAKQHWRYATTTSFVPKGHDDNYVGWVLVDTYDTDDGEDFIGIRRMKESA